VLVFTSLAGAEASVEQVLEIYRLRWQVELTFKRLKSIAQLGHVPSTTRKAAGHALWKTPGRLAQRKTGPGGKSISPWGYLLPRRTPSRWREFQFAFHQTVAAIAPAISLKAVLMGWNAIAHALSEPNRVRRPQIEALF